MGKTDEQILYEFTVQSLKVCKLDTKIKELTGLRNAIAAQRDENFKIYNDRLKQRGEQIDLTHFVDLSEFEEEEEDTD